MTPQKTDEPNTRQRLLGAWRLISLTERTSKGEVRLPFGQDPVGLLLYDNADRVSAQIMRRNQPRFAHNDWQRVSDQEKAAAWSAYLGYFGTYRIDENARAVIHHIEGSWYPNFVGSEQVRYFQFADEKLILSADVPGGRVEIVWEKVKG